VTTTAIVLRELEAAASNLRAADRALSAPSEGADEFSRRELRRRVLLLAEGIEQLLEELANVRLEELRN
jgi:hypothetical protein